MPGVSCRFARVPPPPMPTAHIFISYRRDDAAGYARAIYDALARQFGAERVFIDVDDIAAGQAFVDVIHRAVGSSQVLLVLIGKRWRGEREGQAARLDEPGDLVRAEVAAALAHGMRIIPVLLDGAAMPAPESLPRDLRPLAGRNALELGNSRFAADIERLCLALQGSVGAPAKAPPRRLWAVGLGGGLLLAAAGLTWRLWAAAPARPGLNGRWQADVTYDWPNAHYTERFDFAGEGTEVHGTASFLGVGRGVLEGRIDNQGLRFVTRTSEIGGQGTDSASTHRYIGRWVGDEIHVVMQTEGGSSDHAPVEFVARRAP
jgi:hypothetical protein